MGWSILITNYKVLILITILLIFVLIAVFIVYVEIKIKRRTEILAFERVENAKISAIWDDLKNTRLLEEKLNVIDKHAKKLFNEKFNLDSTKSYSDLINFFNEKKEFSYSVFCKRMFEVYYSNEALTDEKIKNLLTLLIRLIRENRVNLDPLVNSLYSKQKQDLTVVKKVDNLNPLNVPPIEQANVLKVKQLLMVKEKSLAEKERLLIERQRTIEEKEKEILKKEKASRMLIDVLESKIKIHDQKIAEEVRLQKEIEQKILLEHNMSEILRLEKEKREKLEKTLRQQETKKHWREDVQASPVLGKDWLKMRSRGRKL